MTLEESHHTPGSQEAEAQRQVELTKRRNHLQMKLAERAHKNLVEWLDENQGAFGKLFDIDSNKEKSIEWFEEQLRIVH